MHAIQKPHLVTVRQKNERHVELLRVMTSLAGPSPRPHLCTGGFPFREHTAT